MTRSERHIDGLRKATGRLKEKAKKDTRLSSSLVVATCAVWAIGAVCCYGIKKYKDGGNA